MLQDNEVLTFLLGCAVLCFALINTKRLRNVPGWGLLFGGFCASFAGWLLTNAEAFVWRPFLNVAEHVCYAASACLLAFWCHRVFGRAADR